MTSTQHLLACLMGPCPECANGVLEVVSDGVLTNFLCPKCGNCWHAELDFTHRVNPATCPGCGAREVCLAAPRPYGEPISRRAPGALRSPRL